MSHWEVPCFNDFSMPLLHLMIPCVLHRILNAQHMANFWSCASSALVDLPRTMHCEVPKKCTRAMHPSNAPSNAPQQCTPPLPTHPTHEQGRWCAGAAPSAPNTPHTRHFWHARRCARLPGNFSCMPHCKVPLIAHAHCCGRSNHLHARCTMKCLCDNRSSAPLVSAVGAGCDD